MPPPRAALGSRRQGAPLSSPIATGGRRGAFLGGGDGGPGSSRTPIIAFAAAGHSSQLALAGRARPSCAFVRTRVLHRRLRLQIIEVAEDRGHREHLAVTTIAYQAVA